MTSNCGARRSLFPAAFGLLAMTAPAASQVERTVTPLADGVYEIRHRDRSDGFEGGNTTVIIGARQVLVVDAPFLPSEAREDIAQIRRWTGRPVGVLVNTHFHNDHNLGNAAYLEAFPGVMIVAQAETKRDMDRFGPGSARRVANGTAAYQRMLDQGKAGDGRPLTTAETAEVRTVLARRKEVAGELDGITFQSATVTFDHELTFDLGNREVRVLFLGRGNTAGDAVVYLPKERIVAAGDLVVQPVPYFYDGYPTEWIQTLDNLARLDAGTIVPGHGPILHDQSYLRLVGDLMKSAVGQMSEALRKTGPAMFRTVDAVKGAVDLTPFRRRFAGNDKALSAAFDQAAETLVALVFREASLR